MFRTYIDSLKHGDLDAAAKCLDLTDIPDPARRIVGRALAFKLKEVLDRNVFVIFQDLPDSSVGLPLEAVVHKEGRITAERQVSGKRKGQWLFNRATVQSVDRLYDEFESKPLVPELVAIGHTTVEVPGFDIHRDCGSAIGFPTGSGPVLVPRDPGRWPCINLSAWYYSSS